MKREPLRGRKIRWCCWWTQPLGQNCVHENSECWVLEEGEREIETTQRCLIVSSGNNVVGKTPAHGHALLLVNQQRVLFNFDVFLEALFVPQEVA